MCFGGGQGVQQQQQEELKDKNAPPVVTGKQTGIENPKNTAKATEALKIKRQKEEGTYVDPSQQNLATTAQLTGKKSGGGNKTAQQKANLAANKSKAKSLANARMKRKFSRSITGGPRSRTA